MSYYFDVPCVILAGGKSSRMGQDKALLPFKESPTLTHYQLQRLKPLFQSVHVSIKKPKFDSGILCIEDAPDAPSSPMVALASILTSFKDTYVFVISVDTPFVSPTEIQRLLDAAGEADAIIAKDHTQRHPLCGLYHTRLAPKVQTLVKQDDHKLGQLLESVDTHYVTFEEERPFFNLNHPHEYEEATQWKS